MLLDKIVIGNTVESIFYAIKNDSFLIYTRKRPPLFYRELSIPILGCKREPEALSKLLLPYSLLGKVLQFENTESIRIIGNKIKIFSQNDAHEYEFETCEIFDSTGLTHENPIVTPNPPVYHVIDDFELKNLGRSVKTIPSMKQEDSFVSSLHFYTSGRVDGASFITDCVSDSHLTMMQLQEFDYSDSIIKFVVERYLRTSGVNGTVAGMNKNGTTKYRRPLVTHSKRLVFECDKNIYKDTPELRFINPTLTEIINE
jgi:hypothetical protein